MIYMLLQLSIHIWTTRTWMVYVAANFYEAPTLLSLSNRINEGMAPVPLVIPMRTSKTNFDI
jgi:hypothetical protein